MANKHFRCEPGKITDQVEWDCIVIGAGPAGSTAAIQLGRKGYSVLLVDKKSFPRAKVCGGCLSGKAVNALIRLNLSHVIEGSVPLTKFVLGVPGRSVNLASVGGKAISREKFDHRLIQVAIKNGVTFLPATNATLDKTTGDVRIVRIQRDGVNQNLNAKVTLVCTGLANPDSNAMVPLEHRVDERSRIGLTTIVDSDEDIETGTIYMSVDTAGYLGIARLENGQINISACVKQTAIQGDSSPEQYAIRLMRNLALNPPARLTESRWMGTPKLTRHLKVSAGERVFALGDAAKYLEPFTGEGIGWAIESAVAVQPFVEQSINRWDPALINQWDRELSRLLSRRQRVCNAMKYFASRPKLVGFAIPFLKRMPALSRPIMNAIHGKRPHHAVNGQHP